MSQRAKEKLLDLWGKLVYSQIKKVITDPRDILSINVQGVIEIDDGVRMLNHHEYSIESRDPADIPPSEMYRTSISWKHYYGFTNAGFYFRKSTHRQLDLSLGLTLDWGQIGNFYGGWDLPEVGSIIVGDIRSTPKGQQYSHWFVCPKEFELLHHFIRLGTSLSDKEVGRLLFSNGQNIYWAIARLVLFDNVQAFVDELKGNPPEHPCYGQEYQLDGVVGNKKPKVTWRGMQLPKHPAAFVHMLSMRLDEPMWWEEFKRLAQEQEVPYEDHNRFGWCEACSSEAYTTNPNDWPYPQSDDSWLY